MQAIADAPVGFFENTGDLRLPQVHALNCLKDVFTDALLGQASEPHIADTLEISAGCLESSMYGLTKINEYGGVMLTSPQMGNKKLWPHAISSATEPIEWRH